MSNTDAIDWELCVKLANGKAELAQTMLDMFMQELPNELALLQQLLAEQNYEELQFRVHRLHGASCYCGVPHIKDAASVLETSLKNRELDDAHALTRGLIEKINDAIISYQQQNYHN